MCKEIKEQLFKLILQGDRAGAVSLVSDWATNHTYQKAIAEILEPCLERFGREWENNEEINLAQGYIAGKIAEDVLNEAFSETQPLQKNGRKGPIVIGNIEDDCHALGRRLVTIFLKTNGWKVYDLGNDVLPSEFVDKALEVNAPIIAASAMMYTTALNIKNLRKEIDDRGLNGTIKLAVGGAVFRIRPEMVELVGGDGTAPNALETPALMRKLLSQKS